MSFGARRKTGINSSWFLGLIHNHKVNGAAEMPGGEVSRTLCKYEEILKEIPIMCETVV